MDHIRKVLHAFNFPLWTLNNLQNKFNHKHNIHNGHTTTGNQPITTNNNGSNSKNISIVVPYIHGLGERFKRTCNNLGIQVHFKWSNTIKSLLMVPKDRDNKLKKWDYIQVTCPHINCPEEYIEESGRSFRDRLREHLRVPSPTHYHSHSTRYPVSPDASQY